VSGDARAQVLVRHPLQPFDPRNFTPGELGGAAPWSFNRVTLDGARAMEEERVEPRPFLASPLPPRTDPVLELEDLVAFVRHPVRAFLRQRLGFGVGTYADEIADSLPIELDGLESWQIGQRLLDARLAGATADAAVAAERARGELPPGVLADPVLDKLVPDVEQIVGHADALLPTAALAGSVDVRVTLPDGRRLNGTVPGVHGTLLRSVTYSRVNARHRLVTWVRFLALTAAHAEREFDAATVGRAVYGGPSGATVTVVRLPRMAPEIALEHLASLAALYDDGMCEPLPLACKTSAAHAAGGKAAKEWESDWKFTREDAELEHQLVFGGVLSFADLAARPDFDRRARQLWDGPLGWEQVGFA
jgi:exodeoxyribonuclease V gamma subunit